MCYRFSVNVCYYKTLTLRHAANHRIIPLTKSRFIIMRLSRHRSLCDVGKRNVSLVTVSAYNARYSVDFCQVLSDLTPSNSVDMRRLITNDCRN